MKSLMKALILVLAAAQVAAAASLEPVMTLSATGAYVHIIGRSLFLTPGKVLGRAKKQVEASGALFDLSENPAAPRLVASPLPPAWDLVLVENYAVACNYEKFITVYDTGQQPWREVARLDLPSMAENIRLRDRLAYVATHNAGLTVVDVSKPTQPRIVSRLDPKIDCDAVAFWRDTIALYGHHQSQIIIADISDPSNPRQIGLCQLAPGILNGGEMEIENGYAYVTTKTGLVVVNVAAAAQPALVATVNLGAVAHDVVVKDGYAFVAADERGVRVLDVSNPRKPVAVAHYQPGNNFLASALTVERANQSGAYYVYVANLSGPAVVLVFRPPAQNPEGKSK